jgi:hypothetical protein
VTDSDGDDSGAGSFFYAMKEAIGSASPSTVELDTNVTYSADTENFPLAATPAITIDSESGSTYDLNFDNDCQLEFENQSGTSAISFTGVNFVCLFAGGPGTVFSGTGLTASVANATVYGFGLEGAAFTVGSGASLSVSNGTFSNDAYGVFNESTSSQVTLSSDTFSEVTQDLFDDGTASVTNCTFYDGGGSNTTAIVDDSAPSLTVTGSTFTGLINTVNYGCAIDALDYNLSSKSTLVVNTSVFTGNTGDYPLAINDSAIAKEVLVENCSFTNNSQGDVLVTGGAEGDQSDESFVNDWWGNSSSYSLPSFKATGAGVTFTGCMWSNESDANSAMISLNPSSTAADYYAFAYSTLLGNTSNGPAVNISQSNEGDQAAIWYSTFYGNTNTSSSAYGGAIAIQQPTSGGGYEPYDQVDYSTLVLNSAKYYTYGGALAVSMPKNGNIVVISSVESGNTAGGGDPEFYTYQAPGSTVNPIRSDGANANDSTGSQAGWLSTDSDAGHSLEFNNGLYHDSRNPYIAYTLETSGGWIVGHGDTASIGQLDQIQQTVKSPVITGAVDEEWNLTNQAVPALNEQAASSFVPTTPILTSSIMSATGIVSPVASVAIAGATVVPGAVQPVLAAIAAPKTASLASAKATGVSVISPLAATASAVAPVAKTTVAIGTPSNQKSPSVTAVKAGFKPIRAKVSTLSRRLPAAQSVIGASKLLDS